MVWHRVLYNGLIWIAGIGLKGLAALGHQRIKRWERERKDLSYPTFSQKPLLFHVSSLGEFEMALPVIQQVRLRNPQVPILVSFFSPSGYQFVKRQDPKLPITYLPWDTSKAMDHFLETVRPRAILFSKYDFWPNLIWKAGEKGIPLIAFGVSLSRKWYYRLSVIRSFYRDLFALFRVVLHQTPQSERVYRHFFRLENGRVGGDPRFDRVLENRNVPFVSPELAAWKGNTLLLIAGSTWEKDERLLARIIPYQKGKMKMVVVPHEVSEKRLNFIRNQFPESVFWSQVKGKKIPDSVPVLIIDQMGLLKYLYRYGDFAYVGGGFDDGIHNILEAAVYEIPIFFGPHYHHFWEGVELKRLGCAFPVTSPQMLSQMLMESMKPNRYRQIQNRLKNYIARHSGATQRIVSYIEPYLS